MPLYIKDPEVSGLAEDAVKFLGVANKTEAVRMALKAAIAGARAKKPLEDRIRDLQDRVAAMGPRDPDYDHKAYMREIWGDDD
jgi:antitoxin VapB